MKSNMSTYKNYYFISAYILVVNSFSTRRSTEDTTIESRNTELTRSTDTE